MNTPGLDEVTRLRAALAEARAEVVRWQRVAEDCTRAVDAAGAALTAVREWAEEYVGQWNPAIQEPLTFDGGVGAAAHDVLARLGAPTTTERSEG